MLSIFEGSPDSVKSAALMGDGRSIAFSLYLSIVKLDHKNLTLEATETAKYWKFFLCSIAALNSSLLILAKPSQAKPSQAKPSQAKPSQAKPKKKSDLKQTLLF